MKRILDSSGKQSKISFDIQLDQQKYYLRGDVIEGHIFLQSPKPIRVKNIRLQWSGRVRVQLEPTLRDERELFKETTYMELPETESATETARREAVKKAAMTVTGLFLVPSSTSKLAHFVEADKLYSYPFSFIIPENTILPSCTESEINVGGIVEYIIEAYLERPVSDFSSSIKAQIRVPVLQRIDTSRPEQIVPQSVQVECRGSPWLRGEGRENDGMAMITATVPKKAFIRNQPVPITVDINHFEPFKRKQALTIALVCVCRILCKGASYILPDSIIHSVKADIDLSNENNLSQTVIRSILIPRNISPTIGVNAQLLEISYKIRVRAQLQPDDPTRSYNMSMINIPTNFQSLALLTAELPIEIGTLPMSDKFIPPVPLDPQFVNYLDTASVAKIASTVDTDSCRKDDVTIVQQDEEKNNLSPTTPEKVHMLKKMQRMLRLTSPSQIEAAKQLIPDNNEQDMPMTKNELFSLFEEAASLKSNNSDESSIRTGTTSAAGRHSSISTFVSSSSEQSSISQQKTMFPPPPTSPAPTVQQQRHQSANTPETKNLPALYRLSLGPELNTPILTSISNDKPQQIDQEPYSNNNSNANNNNNNNNTKLTTEVTKLIINKGQQNHHRRRINSDSIILDLKHNNNNNNDSSSPAPSSAIQQPQQHKRHELISSKSSGAIEGGVHYFYMFPESDSSSSSEEEQRRTKNKLKKKKRKSIRKKQEYCATTPAGFEKPNSVSGVNVNEAQVERLQIIRQNNNNAPSSSNTPYPVTHVDKPDELSNSEAEGLSSSHEEDLLDVLQRRDRKIASRMN